jgi:hypothetical protein
VQLLTELQHERGQAKVSRMSKNKSLASGAIGRAFESRIANKQIASEIKK